MNSQTVIPSQHFYCTTIIGRSSKIEILSILFDFYIEPLIEDFGMGSFSKFSQAIPEIFELQCSKKRNFLRQGLEVIYVFEMASKIKFLMFFFCNFLEINTHDFVKIDPNLKIRAYLMQHFMEFDMKKLSDPKTLTFGVWDLKTSLGQFGPIVFGKGLIKQVVKKPSSNFHKQDLILSRIMR